MEKLTPYLTFPGNCEEAFQFYKSVFGGEFLHFGRFADLPSDGEYLIPEEKLNKVMHVSLPVGKQYILMGSDSDEDVSKQQIIVGNNVSLSISTEKKEEADRIFENLCNGGQIKMQIGDVFWGSYAGMCTDRFGINWMISYTYKDLEEKSEPETFLE